MKTSTVLRSLLGAAFAAVLFALPAQADTLDDIKKAGKIRIAIDLAIPPFGMTDDKMQPTGSDVDLARLLAKDLGVELEIVTTTGGYAHPNTRERRSWQARAAVMASRGETEGPRVEQCRRAMSWHRLTEAIRAEVKTGFLTEEDRKSVV